MSVKRDTSVIAKQTIESVYFDYILLILKYYIK